jgi:hypothetical protein
MRISTLIATLSLTATALAQNRMTAEEAQTQFQHIIATNSEAADASVLDYYWEYLPGINVSNAIGTYKVGKLLKLKAADPVGWWGKQIISENSVNPRLATPPRNVTTVKDGAGNALVFPYPRPDIAWARNTVYKGVLSTSIIYHNTGLMEHLRVAREEDAKTGQELVLVGKTESIRQQPEQTSLFYLTRVNQTINLSFKNP